MLVQAESYESFLSPWIWNMVLFGLSGGKYMACTGAGLWGLFWYNDGGEMIEACLNIGGAGTQAEFVYETMMVGE